MAGLNPTLSATLSSSNAEEPGIGDFLEGYEDWRCKKCDFSDCDVRVSSCGCPFHARCLPLEGTSPLTVCPVCNAACTSLYLFPMSFKEIDEALKTEAILSSCTIRAKKRKSGSDKHDQVPKTGTSFERRTGRWTQEEMAYVDKIITCFEDGSLPLSNGIKLNEFLGKTLNSQQSRLTKKMKNAKLSSKSFSRISGYIFNSIEAREFSDTEDSFFDSIQGHVDRAEMRFHTQKEWRELFSNLCVTLNQPLDVESWLGSVEEMDRRVAMAKESSRRTRMKLPSDSNRDDLAASASFRADSKNSQKPIRFNSALPKIPEPQVSNATQALVPVPSIPESAISPLFLHRVVACIKKYSVPFEHVDAWVPSVVPGASERVESESPRFKLCFAGHATAETQITAGGRVQTLTPDERARFAAFGEYSSQYSFEVGNDVSGRVFQSFVPSWEQSVQHAPSHHILRQLGARRCGINTMVGIPVPIPEVGRIVLILYSRYDRRKDQDLVNWLGLQFTNMAPTPKWELSLYVRDTSATSPPPKINVLQPSIKSPNKESTSSNSLNPTTTSKTSVQKDKRIEKIISLLAETMPSDPLSPLMSYLPGFMTLRLTLIKSTAWNEQEAELIHTLLHSYSSYTAANRDKRDIALLLSRDCMFLTEQQKTNSPQDPNKKKL